MAELFLPDVKDHTEWIFDITVLALAPPAKDLAAVCFQDFPGFFQVIDEQLHYWPAKFVVLDDKEVQRPGIKIGELCVF
jgi:hypothetical protein